MPYAPGGTKAPASPVSNLTTNTGVLEASMAASAPAASVNWLCVSTPSVSRMIAFRPCDLAKPVDRDQRQGIVQARAAAGTDPGERALERLPRPW